MSKFGNWLKTFFKGLDTSLSNLSDRFWHNTTFGQGLSNLFNNAPMGDIMTGLVNSSTGAGLTPAQREANEFTASEAEKTRQWQEHMRATNFQTQVGDMRAAGLNPALMYASGGSSSTPSGPSASSVAPSAPASLQEMLAAVKLKKELKILDAQKDNIESQTTVNTKTAEKIGAETTKIGVDTDFVRMQMEYYPKLTESQIRKIDQEVALLYEQIPLLRAETKKTSAEVGLINAQKILTQRNSAWVDRLNKASIEKMVAEKDLAAAQKLIVDFRKEYMDRYHTDVPASGWSSFIGYMANMLDMTVVETVQWLAGVIGKTLSKVPTPTVNVEQNTNTNPSPSLPPQN